MPATQPEAAVSALMDGLTMLHDIGLDSEGRSHHYDPDSHEVVVFDTDARGDTSAAAEVERIEIPDSSTGAWDYIKYVEQEVDGLEFVETDASRRPPEETR